MIPPIAVIAFNRPYYLGPVLQSIAEQQGVQIGRIALFQDGLVNLHSGKRYGKPEVIDQELELFRRFFPQGKVFVSEHNLGPALNIDRAEKWLFEECDADEGIIFEDDLVVSPYYVNTLLGVLDATYRDERVGYVAAYGPLVPAPQMRPNAYIPMHTNWGFALRRRNWKKMKPYVDAYLDIVRERDYRDRDMGAIMALREGWGMPGAYTTQDVLRTVALRLTGGIKIMPHARLGRYIGAQGLHISPQSYETAGFGKLPLYMYPLDGFGPVDDRLYQWCCQFHDQFTGVGSLVA